MRKFLVIGWAMAALAFVGCGDGDEGGNDGSGGTLAGAGGSKGKTPDPLDPCSVDPQSEACLDCDWARLECLGGICEDENMGQLNCTNRECPREATDPACCADEKDALVTCIETRCPDLVACGY